MSQLATLALNSDVVAAAADRAKQQGLTTEEYVMQVLLRDMELDPSEKAILVYDAAEPGTPFGVDREEGESDERYEARSSAFKLLFP
jgi:hypothetical protein